MSTRGFQNSFVSLDDFQFRNSIKALASISIKALPPGLAQIPLPQPFMPHGKELLAPQLFQKLMQRQPLPSWSSEK
jgi:hypothetical protein